MELVIRLEAHLVFPSLPLLSVFFLTLLLFSLPLLIFPPPSLLRLPFHFLLQFLKQFLLLLDQLDVPRSQGLNTNTSHDISHISHDLSHDSLTRDSGGLEVEDGVAAFSALVGVA